MVRKLPYCLPVYWVQNISKLDWLWANRLGVCPPRWPLASVLYTVGKILNRCRQTSRGTDIKTKPQLERLSFQYLGSPQGVCGCCTFGLCLPLIAVVVLEEKIQINFWDEGVLNNLRIKFSLRAGDTVHTQCHGWRTLICRWPTHVPPEPSVDLWPFTAGGPDFLFMSTYSTSWALETS